MAEQAHCILPLHGIRIGRNGQPPDHMAVSVKASFKIAFHALTRVFCSGSDHDIPGIANIF